MVTFASYSYSAGTGAKDLGNVSGTGTRVAMEYTGSQSGDIQTLNFDLKKSSTGSPTGNVYAGIWDSSGTQLAISAPIAVSTLTTSLQTITFTLPNCYELSTSTVYIGCEHSDTPSPGYLGIGLNTNGSPPTSYAKAKYWNGSAWTDFTNPSAVLNGLWDTAPGSECTSVSTGGTRLPPPPAFVRF